MTANPISDPAPGTPLGSDRPGCWSSLVRIIEEDGGPITLHPDAETLRRRAERIPKPHLEPAPIGPVLGNTESPMDLDEDPPEPIPARPYVLEPRPPSRRGWLARAFRRFT
jgi:hypothetical protein